MSATYTRRLFFYFVDAEACYCVGQKYVCGMGGNRGFDRYLGRVLIDGLVWFCVVRNVCCRRRGEFRYVKNYKCLYSYEEL